MPTAAAFLQMINTLGPRDTEHILALDALDTQMARQSAYLTKQARSSCAFGTSPSCDRHTLSIAIVMRVILKLHVNQWEKVHVCMTIDPCEQVCT